MWIQPAQRPQSVPDAIYLAFRKEEDDTGESPALFESLYRLARGPYVHAEIIVRRNGGLARYIVAQPVDHNILGRVFRSETNPKYSQSSWDFLHLDFNETIAAALEASLARGDFYSKRAKLISGLPHLPEFVYDLILGKQLCLVLGGRAVFCGSHIMHALHAGGLLLNYPAEKCGASDLYALATRYSKAIDCPSPFPYVKIVDATNRRVSTMV